MDSDPNSAQNLLKAAMQALKAGDRRTARRLAEQSAAAAPQNEETWLLLAYLASPGAAQYYLDRALQINPASPRVLAAQGCCAAGCPERAARSSQPFIGCRGAHRPDVSSQRRTAARPAPRRILRLRPSWSWRGRSLGVSAMTSRPARRTARTPPGDNRAVGAERPITATGTSTPTAKPRSRRPGQPPLHARHIHLSGYGYPYRLAHPDHTASPTPTTTPPASPHRDCQTQRHTLPTYPAGQHHVYDRAGGYVKPDRRAL